MIDHILKWIFIAMVFLGVVAFIALVIPAMARAQHDINPQVISASFACRDADAATALMQAGDRRGRMTENFVADGTCIFLNQLVTFHQVVEEVVWLGDGLDDMMVIVKVIASDGTPWFSWTTKTNWERLGIEQDS